MRFGVNYTPSVGWFHSWLDFAPDDAARDLDQIAELGVDHVRVFPLWPLVQPNRTLIRPAALDDVAALVDLAAERGLDVAVDAVQGHLSSFDFLPAWLTTWHRRNLFTDQDVMRSTADYVRALASAVAGRPNLLGLGVGNEMNQFAHAPHPFPHVVSAAEGHAWLQAMTDAAREGLGHASARGPAVTISQYDAAWYDDAQPFGPEHAAGHGDATVTHSWVFNGAALVDGPLGPTSVRHAEYLMQLAAAWNVDPARPNWLQEVGAPTNVVPPRSAPDFLEATVRSVRDVQDAWGVTWWCSHDVSRTLADFPELEYDLGLFTDDRRRKPTGDRFAEVVAELRSTSSSAPPATALLLDDVDRDGRALTGVRAGCSVGGSFARAWVRRAEEDGRGPQVLLRSRSADRDEVARRGIRRIDTVPAEAEADATAPRSSHPAAMV